MIVLEKVISGGQTGADEAGLEAAWQANFKTGGHAPKGYRTLNGANTKLRTKYGLIEHESFEYRPRTILNVKNSDGTARFAEFFNSPGELLTKRAIDQEYKPWFDADMTGDGVCVGHDCFLQWLDDHQIKILNVSGNTEQTSPGIYKKVLAFLTECFDQI